MLIDNTHAEETRVVVVNGNKLEDVEFETSSRKQIKGNVYLAKIMRVEPSLQACFVDYGGNRHGFLAFGEIHPDYYNISAEDMEALDKEVEATIESKKQSIRDRELDRERVREEKAIQRAKYEAEKVAQEKVKKDTIEANSQNIENSNEAEAEANIAVTEEEVTTEAQVADGEKTVEKRKFNRKRPRRQRKPREEQTELKVLAEAAGTNQEFVSEDVESKRYNSVAEEEIADDDDDDDDTECDFEVQKKLLKARKLFHKSKIQDVIKEGQILLVQVVKEERGNKGAALTTYLSLAGRYCVLMPNRIKSGGVSRKITNVADRKRLKSIVKELPLNNDMSIIVRTAGEEKTKADIVRDYNYLIRSWNNIRIDSLKAKAPAMIHEEGNLIKRALRDIYTKEIAEIMVAGEKGFKMARDFFKILSPHSLKKIKLYKNIDMPLFQRFQVETQLDKLHETTAQLDSGGYLVINPTEALVAIDVNSGRATKEKDLEETALKTNLEACDEIAKQLRMRNLAGLVVIDFIDMEEQSNNHAIEKRMKEALKKDRSRIQVGKMSMFGLLELSRQRMHSSFFESNYQVCPHCQGKGIIRTIESSAVLVLRGIEEEGIKNRSSRLDISVPTDIAVYLLNQKRKSLTSLEQKYNMDIIICADNNILNIAEYKIDRTKSVKLPVPAVATEEKETFVEKPVNQPIENTEKVVKDEVVTNAIEETTEGDAENNQNSNPNNNNRNNRNFNRRDNNRRGNNKRGRYNDKNNRYNNNRNNNNGEANAAPNENNNGNFVKEKSEAIILYNSHGNNTSTEAPKDSGEKSTEKKKGKATWWKKLIQS